MSSRSRKIAKWVILTLLLAYAAGISVWANREARDHVCTGIEVVVDGGNQPASVVSRGIVEDLMRYPRKIVGTQLHDLNVAEIEKFIARNNNFESVNCIISSRGKLVVKIVPLIPVMRVFYGDQSLYINKDGRHIVSNAEFYNDVPIVTGQFNKKFSPKAILPLVNFISNDKMLSELVSMVEAKDANNLILIPRIRGHVINFGDTTRLEEKKQALSLFYRQVMPYKGWEEYDTISVKFKGQVVATRRDKTRLNVPEQIIEDVDPEEGTLQDVDDSKLPGANPQAATEKKEGVETKQQTEVKPENKQNKPQG